MALDPRPAARAQLAAHGWIPRKAELFRHLPPPPAAAWLGEEASIDDGPPDCGWSLRDIPGVPVGNAELRWFDMVHAAQRARLLSGLPLPGEDDAAPFAWAHRALLRHALRVRVGAAGPGAAPTFLHLAHRGHGAVEAPLLLLELEAGARCVLLETHEGGPGVSGVQNLQVHVVLEEGAHLQHLRSVSPAAGDRLAHHVHARLERAAVYAQCLLAGTAAYHLQRNVFELQGEDAVVQVAGVLLGATGALEQQVLARHAAPRTRSGVEMIALPGARAQMVASAHTRIAPGCDDADVRQRLAGIPVAGHPRIVLRPHLEIHHDQVQAAHGATWGALPEEALFHARQRGLDEAQARSLIVAGLARAVLARAIDEAALPPALRLEDALAAALARQFGSAGTEPAHG
ncbi:SufD family Fe-S cluster assembly protein [Ramlibacter sp. AN1133]|uniref:SufD family Fe-S cluster assembly protein n=1 Tax=Ramlibacter sp. AN1133 TaxID=3133429 RepID=UPI0030BC7BFC